MAGPIGPRTVTKVRQVAIPAVLLESAGLGVGSQVYFRLSPDDSRVIEIVPADRVEVKA